MNESIDNRVKMSVHWRPQPFLERLAAAIASVLQNSSSSARSAELEELHRLTEAAYSASLPSAPDYPAPDLHFLKPSYTPVPANATRRAGPLHDFRQLGNAAGFSIPAPSRRRSMLEACFSRLAVASRHLAARTRQSPAAYDVQLSYACVPAPIWLDAGIPQRPLQDLYFRGSGRPLAANGAY